MKRTSLFAIIAGAMLLTSSAFASTSAEISVSSGQSRSMSYDINLTQTYEPWVSTQTAELTPFAEVGGHLWVPNSGKYDNVWGASIAPGLKLSLFTESTISPFLAVSVGGAANSKTHIGSRDLGSNVLFKTKGVVGIAFGEESRQHLQGEYTQYSNWGVSDKNDGYSTIGASYGYSF